MQLKKLNSKHDTNLFSNIYYDHNKSNKQKVLDKSYTLLFVCPFDWSTICELKKKKNTRVGPLKNGLNKRTSPHQI